MSLFFFFSLSYLIKQSFLCTLFIACVHCNDLKSSAKFYFHNLNTYKIMALNRVNFGKSDSVLHLSA